MLYFLNTAQFEKGFELVAHIQNGFDTYNDKLITARKIIFYFNITLLYFLAEKNHTALDWLNRIIALKTDSRKDIQNFSRILLLILHYELKNHILLESFIRSTRRHLYKLEVLHHYEKTLLKGLKKIFWASSISNTQTASS